jgi:hypothetical protein
MAPGNTVLNNSQSVNICDMQGKKLITFIRFSVADPGCLSQIPDPDFTHTGSRIQKQQQKREVKKN